jgi:hypothetical protein
MKSGYAKTYRKILNSDVWKMPPLYERVFKYLILKAKYKTEEFPTRKGFCIYLLPGQIITSMDTIAEDVGWYEWGVEKKPNKKTIKDILTWLEGNSMVTVLSNAHGTFIEVVNWRFYHGGDEEKVTQNNQPEVTQEKRLLETIKEVKEVKELKNLKILINTLLRDNSKSEEKIFTSDSYEYRLAKLLFAEIRQNNPESKEPNLQSWSKEFDLILRVDKRNPKEVAAIIRWCQKDDFWYKNILSPKKLRGEKYDQLKLKMSEGDKSSGGIGSIKYL